MVACHFFFLLFQLLVGSSSSSGSSSALVAPHREMGDDIALRESTERLTHPRGTAGGALERFVEICIEMSTTT